MESSDRKATTFRGADRRAVHVSPNSSVGIGANVSVSLYLLGHSAGYLVPLFWSIPASFFQRLWAGNLAARFVFPWSVCWHGICHSVGSNLAPELHSPGAQP